ncbi:MAG TPA: sulfite exporter TauE/SafE family protein [Gemmataceae bacterium]|nr:sulfite exporter TauE/SafE family protein [Gemmataceae bacterium]
MTDAFGLAALLFLTAVLYTAAGQAGASGYLAVMAVYGLAPDDMRPAALVLNLVASAVTAARFRSAGHFDRGLFLPLALGSIPSALIGGFLSLPEAVYRPLLAAVLLAAAVWLAWPKSANRTGSGCEDGERARRMPIWARVVSGAAVGLLAGLTGVGGGVFLMPLLLLGRWVGEQEAAGVTAAFILVTSAAGLIGRLAAVPALPDQMPLWIGVVAAGGLIGSTLGSRFLSGLTLRRLLAVVLVIVVGKLLFG